MRLAVVIVAVLLGGCGRGEPAPSRPGGAEPAGATRSADPGDGEPARDGGVTHAAAGPTAGEAASGDGPPAQQRGVDGPPAQQRGVDGPAQQRGGDGPPAQQRGVDGRCEPTPRSGAPCREGDGYCVLSWGEPGGHSEALWCRGGRWVLEQEVNLPRDG